MNIVRYYFFPGTIIVTTCFFQNILYSEIFNACQCISAMWMLFHNFSSISFYPKLALFPIVGNSFYVILSYSSFPHTLFYSSGFETGSPGTLGFHQHSRRVPPQIVQIVRSTALLCSFVNRGPSSHWDASLGFRSSKEVEKH